MKGLLRGPICWGEEEEKTWSQSRLPYLQVVTFMESWQSCRYELNFWKKMEWTVITAGTFKVFVAMYYRYFKFTHTKSVSYNNKAIRENWGAWLADKVKHFDAHTRKFTNSQHTHCIYMLLGLSAPDLGNMYCHFFGIILLLCIV